MKTKTWYVGFFSSKAHLKKLQRETLNLLTDADSSSDTFFVGQTIFLEGSPVL